MSLRQRSVRESLDAAKLRSERKELCELLAKSIDAEAFLADTIGARNIRREKDELMHSCALPFGQHAHGDRSGGAAFNVKKLKVNCFLCGGGDIFWLLATVRGATDDNYTIDDAIKELTGQLSQRELTAEEFVTQLTKLFEDTQEVSFSMPRYHTSVLKPWLRYSEYLTSRGVSEETQREMRTGVDLNSREVFEMGQIKEWIQRPRLVLPHFFGGELRGWQKRRLDNHKYGAKYRSSPGFPRQQTLFGLDTVEGSDIIVVESPMSKYKMLSQGYRNVAATMGAKVMPEQLALLARYDKVYSFMDADNEGSKANRIIVDGLKKRTNVFVVPIEVEDTDPADYDRRAIDVMLKWAEPAALWEIHS